MATRLLLFYLLPGLVAFLVCATGTHLLAPRLLRSRIVGHDVHKRGRPEVAEMGGIALFAGMVGGMATAIAIATFFDPFYVRTPLLTAALATIGVLAVIGVADDIVSIRQRTKAILPVFSALPLAAIAAGNPQILLPVLGSVNIGVLFPLLVVPIVITGAANATNMLAGWNGLEAGLGLVLFTTLSVYGGATSNTTLLAITLPGATACLAFLVFNWHPARVFPGDVGCLTIGGAFAAAVIVGDAELLGAFLIVPFVLDFAMKARHRLPKTFGRLQGEKLVCPPGEPPKGLGQLFLHLSGGMSEPALVLSLLGFEALFAAAGLALVL